MPLRGATDEWRVPRLRSLLGALALVICLSAVAGSATASAGSAERSSSRLVSRATQAHSKSVRLHRRRKHPAARCAKPSSFHTSGGHVHHKRHPHRTANCAKPGSGEQHGAKGTHGDSRHSAPGKRTGHHAKQHESSTGKPADADTCPGADLRPTKEDIEAVRTATLCLVDQERTNHGEAALAPNANLQQSAQDHTESMVSDDYFEHDSPSGDTPLSRMTASGYIFSSHVGYEIGENIGWGTLSLSTPRAIVAAWMASPGHRANILDPRFRDTAIGVSPHVPSSLSESQAGGIYTQDFGVIITG
jgi:uncharacterized protein YkwD